MSRIKDTVEEQTPDLQWLFQSLGLETREMDQPDMLQPLI